MIEKLWKIDWSRWWKKFEEIIMLMWWTVECLSQELIIKVHLASSSLLLYFFFWLINYFSVGKSCNLLFFFVVRTQVHMKWPHSSVFRRKCVYVYIYKQFQWIHVIVVNVELKKRGKHVKWQCRASAIIKQFFKKRIWCLNFVKLNS